MFSMIFLCRLNTCESSEYFKMIFEELGFIPYISGSLLFHLDAPCGPVNRSKMGSACRITIVICSQALCIIESFVAHEPEYLQRRQVQAGKPNASLWLSDAGKKSAPEKGYFSRSVGIKFSTWQGAQRLLFRGDHLWEKISQKITG